MAMMIQQQYRHIYAGRSSKVGICLTGFPPGLYLFPLQATTGTTSMKFIKV
ncbi:hypothetical protein [Taibaiella koreensis]|uniref:hypothetical protein n=1 Tax=Taibaiella koreensis TaxID=1268548 RepID=UPI0013C3420F|nr:hypothetical protein [Taibaiella koreensis]